MQHAAATQPPNRAVYTVPEFLSSFSVSRSHFYREVRAGRIRLRKIGSKSIVTVPDANAWLNSLPTVGGVIAAANDWEGE